MPTTFEIRSPDTEEMLIELNEEQAEMYARLANRLPRAVHIPKSVLTPLMRATTSGIQCWWSLEGSDGKQVLFRKEGDTVVSLEHLLGQEFKNEFVSLWVLQFINNEPGKTAKRRLTEMLGYALPGYEEETEEDPQMMD